MYAKNLAKLFGTILAIAFVFSITGCGYTREEKIHMGEYEEQGAINASNYITEKYGINATIVDSKCQKVDSGPIPNFSPDATGNVFVTMEYKDREFMVYISGEEETTKGVDNYQLEEITTSLKVMVEDLTNFSIEDIYLCYGHLHTMKNNENGLVSTYFDGDNLSEVLNDASAAVVIAVINQDISGVDLNPLK